MSLQVWLPLNGDLHNQGLASDIQFTTNTGATINNNGKIGKCYSFDATNDWIQAEHDKSMWPGTMTLACWFKSDQSDNGGIIIDIAADLCLGYVYTSSGMQFRFWRCYPTSSGTRTGHGFNTTTVYDVGQWYHVAAVFDGGVTKIYVNGTLSETWDYSNLYSDWAPLLANTYNRISVGKSAGESNWIGGLVNDVRIYDHALTEKEVKEISKGLVLHYPLNLGTPNTQINLLPINKRNFTVNGTNDAGSYNITTSESGAYTLSAYIKRETKDDEWSSPRFSMQIKYTDGNTTYNYTAFNDIPKDGKFHYYELTTTSNPNKTVQSVYGWILDHSTPTSAKYVEVRNAELVHADHANHYTERLNNTNLLIGNNAKITTWNNYMPSSVTLTEDTGGCKYTLVEGIGGWEKIYSDPIYVVPNRTHTLTFDYSVEQVYTGYSGNFGISVCSTPQNVYGNDTNIIGQLEFGTSQLSMTHGKITFTPTVDTIYLVANGGKIADGQKNISFYINNLVLADNQIRDISGLGNNGTLVGSLSTSTDTVRYKTCLSFDGSTYIDCPITCSVSQDAITVSIWGYEENWNTSTAERLIGAATNSSGWAIGDYGSENTLFAFYLNGGYNVATGFKSLSAGWHHLVMTFDGFNLIYYVDGDVYQTKTFTSKQSINGNYHIQLGHHYYDAQWFNGKMSDVRIYATALSADDIKELYEMGVNE